MRETLSSPGSLDWAPPELRKVRLGELDELAKNIALPGMSVVVVGNTGSGKSTLLNALLGETSILPTNGGALRLLCEHFEG